MASCEHLPTTATHRLLAPPPLVPSPDVHPSTPKFISSGTGIRDDYLRSSIEKLSVEGATAMVRSIALQLDKQGLLASLEEVGLRRHLLDGLSPHSLPKGCIALDRTSLVSEAMNSLGKRGLFFPSLGVSLISNKASPHDVLFSLCSQGVLPEYFEVAYHERVHATQFTSIQKLCRAAVKYAIAGTGLALAGALITGAPITAGGSALVGIGVIAALMRGGAFFRSDKKSLLEAHANQAQLTSVFSWLQGDNLERMKEHLFSPNSPIDPNGGRAQDLFDKLDLLSLKGWSTAALGALVGSARASDGIYQELDNAVSSAVGTPLSSSLQFKNELERLRAKRNEDQSIIRCRVRATALAQLGLHEGT